jgi:hypothetical protein
MGHVSLVYRHMHQNLLTYALCCTEARVILHLQVVVDLDHLVLAATLWQFVCLIPVIDIVVWIQACFARMATVLLTYTSIATIIRVPTSEIVQFC